MIEHSAVVGAIIGLSEMAKRYIPARYIPLVSLGMGILAGLFIVPGADLSESIFTGFALGMAASGAYDLGKVARK